MTSIHQKVIAIIDRSGSMSGKEDDTIGGINSCISNLKTDKEENTTIDVSIKLFDHEEIMLIRSQNIDEVVPLTRNDFRPRGSTSLLDAIGNTLSWVIQNKLLNSNFYTNCFIYIATDGQENTSKDYSYEQIKLMIAEAKENYNVNIVYLGANQDAIIEASKYGISAGQAMNYTESNQHTEMAYRSVANAAKRCRTDGSAEFTNAERCASQQ
tara:strand:- start:4011 stop:4646 length:636 start_codon:yes stop_codon:yes gene_type:complete